MDASVICPLKKLTPVLAVALALSACGKPAPQPAPAPAPKPATPNTALDLSQPITANGTEPFWSLNIDGRRFRLSRPEQPDLVATSPGATIMPGRATWIAMGPAGQMTVTLYVSDCSDGMSDRRYPMTAEVAVLNETLHGCAAKTAALSPPAG
jgi:uncharacterized membrane protein